jgi:protein TonB
MRPRIFQPNRLSEPITIPRDITMIDEPPPATGFSIASTGGGLVDGPVLCILCDAPVTPTRPPTPTVEKPAPKQPAVVRMPIGGDVQAAKLVRQLTPAYPALAKAARISGTVRLEAIIGIDGTVQNVRATSGHPMLVPSALDAVRQWVYKPTLLNGRPVEVITQIEVRFALQ